MARIHIIVCAALVAVAGCKRAEVTSAKIVAEPAPVNAAVLRIMPEPFTATIPVTGTLVSNSRVDVKAETTGKITRFDKQEGDLVRAGEPVVWVDQENYNLAIRQADSSVQVAEAACSGPASSRRQSGIRTRREPAQVGWHHGEGL